MRTGGIRIALILGAASCLLFRFSTDIFGQNTMNAVYAYHVGSSIAMLCGWYAVAAFAPKQIKMYLNALVPVCFMHLINDAFYMGQMGMVDLSGLILGILYIFYKLTTKK